MNRRRFFILVLMIALCGVIAAALWSELLTELPTVDQSSEHLGSKFDANSTTGAERRSDEARDADAPQLEPTSGQMLRFSMSQSGTSPAVEATIGMAGLWPPAEASAPAGGLIPLPRTEVATLWGDEMNTYEVLARTPNRSHGFWGEVSIENLDEPDVHEAVLEQASSLEVVITDEGGSAVVGAEVRISRGFVALVHLSGQTDDNGRVVFAGLPDGDFQLTVKAAGYARHMHQFEHTGDAATTTLSLIKGPTKVGNGELERLARQVVVTGNRTVVSTGEKNGQHAEASAQRPRQPLDLYVVDHSGSPVQGALIQLWKDGQRLFERKSAGSSPVRVEIASPFRGTLVAFDGQRGEGSIAVRLSKRANQQEFIITLDRELLTLDLPPGRVNARRRIEQILGAKLIRDNDAWLADVLSPTSPAARAGIERGDRVVFLRDVPGGYSAMVERGAQRMRVQLGSEAEN
jgi:hypothetical protein